MNENENTATPIATTPEYRPSFAIYHPNAKGTGSAMKMDLHPAHDDRDGCIMARFAVQKTSGNRLAATPVFPTFDWENSFCVKFDFSDLCKMLQVFRGECEELEAGKGLLHRSLKAMTCITLRHTLDPVAGYALNLWRTPNGATEAQRVGIFLTPWEALGIALSFENSIGVICFGIPKVIPHDTSAYDAKVREAARVRAA